MHTIRALLFLSLFSACIGSSQGGDPGPHDLSMPPGDLSSSTDLAPGLGPRFDDGLHGSLTLGARVTPYDAAGVVEGQIYKAPRPRFQREVARQGDCRLLS